MEQMGRTRLVEDEGLEPRERCVGRLALGKCPARCSECDPAERRAITVDPSLFSGGGTPAPTAQNRTVKSKPYINRFFVVPRLNAGTS